MKRRTFLHQSSFLALAAMLGASRFHPTQGAQTGQSVLNTRGVILNGQDLSSRTFDWPKLAHEVGLTTIATHVGPADVIPFIQNDHGKRFLEDCARYGIQVEHELHAMNYLLPRNLFEKNPEMFRMNAKGERVADCNCCVHSAAALEMVADKAIEVSKICRSTTGRYFYWLDDMGDVCHCPKCRPLNASDQALIIENTILKALKSELGDHCSLAHLAYGPTYGLPAAIKPDPGIFLEFAPIGRRRDVPVEPGVLDLLENLLKAFPKESAQVLEYWLDVSFFSQWRAPLKQVPWNSERFQADIDAYTRLGIRNFTTFAVCLSENYLKLFGEIECVKEYGQILKNWKPVTQ